MPELLYKDSEQIKKDFGFSSIQEFIKESIRKAIYEYKRQRALRVLKQNFGILKGKVKRLTKEDNLILKEKIMNMTTEENNAILKKYGF